MLSSRPGSGFPCIDNDLGINCGRIFGDERLEAMAEDGVRNTQEQCPGKGWTEHDQCRGDGNLDRTKHVLDCDDRLVTISGFAGIRSKTETRLTIYFPIDAPGLMSTGGHWKPPPRLRCRP